MRKLVAVAWNLVFACVRAKVVVAASYNTDGKHTEEGLFSSEKKPRASDGNRALHPEHLGDSVGGLARLSSNVPRILSSVHPRHDANEFGVTSLSWEDDSESEDETSASSSGNADGLNAPRDPSLEKSYSPLRENKPGTSEPAFTDDSNNVSGTTSSGQETAASGTPPSLKRTTSTTTTETGALKGGSSSESLSLQLDRTSNTTLASVSSSGTHKIQNFTGSWSSEAEDFVASIQIGTNAGASGASAAGSSGLAKYAFVDPTQCMVAVLFGLAKLRGDAQRVRGIDQVIVSNISQQIKIMFKVKKGGLSSGFWERHRARIQSAVGIYELKQQVLRLRLPEACVVDPTSRYFIISTGSAQKSSTAVVESFVLSLGFRVESFRVPRTWNPKPVTVPAAFPQNEWVRQSCTWFLRFSRRLARPPLLTIDRERAIMGFQNDELHDMGQFLLEDKQKSGDAGVCDWSSPVLSSVHVTEHTESGQIQWQVQVDLAKRMDALKLEHEVQVNTSGSLPGHERGIEHNSRSSRSDSFHVPIQ